MTAALGIYRYGHVYRPEGIAAYFNLVANMRQLGCHEASMVFESAVNAPADTGLNNRGMVRVFLLFTGSIYEYLLKPV